MPSESDFHERRYYSWQNSIVGGDPLDLFVHKITHVFMQASFHHSSINHLRARSAACIAATKLVWTVVILNGNKASGPLANGRAIKMHS